MIRRIPFFTLEERKEIVAQYTDQLVDIQYEYNDIEGIDPTGVVVIYDKKQEEKND